MMMGEKRCWNTSARGLTEPEPLTITRKLYSASPRLSRCRRNFAGPGPRLMGAESTVRAPAITASAVARKFEQMLVVARAGERRHRAIGRRDFPVRRHRHVHQHKRQL